MKKAKAKAAAQSNDAFLLKQIVSQTKSEVASELTDDEYFEIFVAEQLLKSHDLNNDEISSGITGGGGDGGIDSIYCFVNGELINEDIDDYSKWKKNIKIDVFIIQAKTAASFNEDSLNKLISVTEDLFSLDADFTSDEIQKRYNEDLLEIVNRFRELYKNLATKFPEISFNYSYVSHGDVPCIFR